MRNFVLVDLYGDGTDPESEANQKLELAKFQTVAEPYYAILDPDENVVATFPGLTHDAAAFLAFLNKGSGVRDQGSGVQAAASTAGSIPQLKTLAGGSVDTAGKVVVMNFWATWCVPCIQEIPSFNKLHKELEAQGVAVVGVSMDEEGAERVTPFLKKHPMDYPVALGSAEMNQQYKLDQLPVTVIFDRSGKQVKRFEGFLKEDELQAAVKTALATKI
jgi:thiol-disulfide isomerase/thioredoxin